MSAPSIPAAAPTSASALWIQWTLSKRGRPTIVSFCGHLGAGEADVLVDRMQTVLDSAPERLIFDLTGVTVIDDDGQRAIARARQHAADKNVRLDVACPATRRSGDVPLDLGDRAGLHASLDEALEA